MRKDIVSPQTSLTAFLSWCVSRAEHQKGERESERERWEIAESYRRSGNFATVAPAKVDFIF